MPVFKHLLFNLRKISTESRKDWNAFTEDKGIKVFSGTGYILG